MTDKTLQLILTALNSSKSAYASFSLDRNVFFEKYNFNPILTKGKNATDNTESRFTCQLYNKVTGNLPNVLVSTIVDNNQALLSVFKGRLGDVRDKDTAVERCECYIQDQPDKTECRLIVKMVCRHGLCAISFGCKGKSDLVQGVIKTYKLTYESIEVMHALFNRNAAKNTWKIGASTLRSFVEYFGANTEQLDISSENGRATFTSYTEKVTNGRGLSQLLPPRISSN